VSPNHQRAHTIAYAYLRSCPSGPPLTQHGRVSQLPSDASSHREAGTTSIPHTRPREAPSVQCSGAVIVTVADTATSSHYSKVCVTMTVAMRRVLLRIRRSRLCWNKVLLSLLETRTWHFGTTRGEASCTKVWFYITLFPRSTGYQPITFTSDSQPVPSGRHLCLSVAVLLSAHCTS
jgi:hypothetical protein